MSIKVKSSTAGASVDTMDTILAVLGVIVVAMITIVVMGLAIWWLVPLATAGAVSLGFLQSVAIGALLAMVGAAFKP